MMHADSGFATEAFITGARMDFSKLYEDSLLALKNPCIRLDDAERGLMKQYLDLAETLLSLDIPNKVEAVKSLGTSIFYLLGTMWRNRLDVAHHDLPARTKRANAVFENFLKLVADHHRQEHGIEFYADKLLLTPKYLSKFIKEIAYNMHFSSVPAFYKFFQKKTGMTPATYRSV